MKTFIWIGGIVIALVALMFWAANVSQINPPFSEDSIHPLDHIKGNASSTVIVVEYSDFQCPACRNYYFAVKELAVEFGDQVAFVYRHFPLNSIHQNAEIAARAAEAAGKQNKFWEMHDLLFEKQAEWSESPNPTALFESYATLVGISVDQFKSDIVSSEVKNLVRAERARAVKIGLQGTPSFFINGEQIQNPGSVADFRVVIKNALGVK